MPRAIWSGTISFGLVTVPVRAFSAISEHTLHFHLVHESDDGRIGYQKVCKLEERPVPDEEIVKAFEFAKGELVRLTDEDFEAAKAEGQRSIEIEDFVPHEQIDSLFFRHTYYLAPQDGGERVYLLLRQAMEDAGLSGIGKFVMRDRQHLGCLRVRDRLLLLEQMYFADEIRPGDELAPRAGKIDRRELELARRLIDSFAGDFQPERYSDSYRDTLSKIVKAKRQGKEVHVAREAPAEEPIDLMDALRASIAARTGGGAGSRQAGGGRTRSRAAPGRDGLAKLSREELYERAKKADIPGRSQMSKSELVRALGRAA